ncbi:ATP-grasp fold amidoligase family protein [Maribacter sp. ACAM166]|uniref:ATP-grasp fold amidoligase family protein n=1 Tax=Maribacter sp. ACAM166 TaxID=2508996 RepID=UPI0010FF5C68|nr:ATP-grasp fold amidoligase family protein [Maribacter sp. ACAM166]TLP70633.1 glycosyl transferase [Maribacter sp. ACAM166]
MKEKIKFLYQNTELGFILIKPYVNIYQYFLHKKYQSHEVFVKQKFKKVFGSVLDLQNPKTLNEKINWLKLKYSHRLATQFADKYAVRSYVADTIGEKYLIHLFFTTKNPKDITPENLPDEPCIIKTNHDSSGGIIIRDKNGPHNWKQIQSRLRANMSQNFYWNGREQQYKYIVPRIIVEKLLSDSSGMLPADYKVHCFNGKVRTINVDIGRGTDHHNRNWYNRNWERESFSWSSVLGNGKLTKPSESDVKKPLLLDKMCELSEQLVIDCPYLRVDWYIFENRLYFGELTFHHNGGMRPIEPKQWDLKLGKELNLPKLK